MTFATSLRVAKMDRKNPFLLLRYGFQEKRLQSLPYIQRFSSGSIFSLGRPAQLGDRPESVNPPEFNLPAGKQGIKQDQDRVLIGESPLGLNPSPKFLVHCLDQVGRPQGLPLGFGKTIEGQKLFSRFFQAGDDPGTDLFPFLDELLISLRGFRSILGIDDLVVVFLDLLPDMFGRMNQEIPKLMHRTTLDRDLWPSLGQGPPQARVAVNNHQFRILQPSTHQIFHHHLPGSRRLLGEQMQIHQNLFPGPLDPHHRMHRNPNDLLGQPHLQSQSIQVKINQVFFGQRAFSPIGKDLLQPPDDPRNRALGKRGILQQGRKRPLNPPGIGPREINPQNRRIHPRRPTLIPRNDPAFPLSAGPALAKKTSPRHHQTDFSHANRKLPALTPVPIPPPGFTPLMTASSQSLLQLLSYDHLDAFSNLRPNQISQDIPVKYLFPFLGFCNNFHIHRRSSFRFFSAREIRTEIFSLTHRKDTPI